MQGPRHKLSLGRAASSSPVKIETGDPQKLLLYPVNSAELLYILRRKSGSHLSSAMRIPVIQNRMCTGMSRVGLFGERERVPWPLRTLGWSEPSAGRGISRSHINAPHLNTTELGYKVGPRLRELAPCGQREPGRGNHET